MQRSKMAWGLGDGGDGDGRGHGEERRGEATGDATAASCQMLFSPRQTQSRSTTEQAVPGQRTPSCGHKLHKSAVLRPTMLLLGAWVEPDSVPLLGCWAAGLLGWAAGLQQSGGASSFELRAFVCARQTPGTLGRWEHKSKQATLTGSCGRDQHCGTALRGQDGARDKVALPQWGKAWSKRDEGKFN